MAVMLAIIMLPLAAFLGGAIDFSMKVSFENRLQNSLDSAVIAMARAIAQNDDVSNEDLAIIAKTLYETNLKIPDNISTSEYKITRTKKTISIEQTAILNTSFMKLVGVDKLNITTLSEVNIARHNIELALIMDLTGSMRGSKLAALKVATTNLVETLIRPSPGLNSLRMGFVTYSEGVNVDAYKTRVIKSNSSGYHKCAASRHGNYRDISPLNKKMPFAIYWNNSDATGSYHRHCPNSPIIPLTDEKQTLLDQISTWQTGGYTSTDTGLAWGWGVLSPKWQDLWPAASRPGEYGVDVIKYAVLMTDGSNTMKHFNADYETLKICKKMRNLKINIYAIAFKAGSRAQKMLKKCVSNPDYYINATSDAALKAAFDKIADQVGSFYLSK